MHSRAARCMDQASLVSKFSIFTKTEIFALPWELAEVFLQLPYFQWRKYFVLKKLAELQLAWSRSVIGMSGRCIPPPERNNTDSSKRNIVASCAQFTRI